MLFFVIAFLAGGYDIVFLCSAASYDRDYVVHCEVFGIYPRVAVPAFALSALSFPPRGFSHFTGCAALPPDKSF